MAAEKNFENKVKKYLESKNAWFIKYWAGSEFTRSGIPDILACIDGRFYGIEIKAKTGKPSMLQLVVLRKIREAKGIGILLYPDDFDNFVKLVEGSEVGEYWYRENRLVQKEWCDKLSR